MLVQIFSTQLKQNKSSWHVFVDHSVERKAAYSLNLFIFKRIRQVTPRTEVVDKSTTTEMRVSCKRYASSISNT